MSRNCCEDNYDVTNDKMSKQWATLIMPPPVGKGAVSFTFVRPSVHLSRT